MNIGTYRVLYSEYSHVRYMYINISVSYNSNWTYILSGRNRSILKCFSITEMTANTVCSNETFPDVVCSMNSLKFLKNALQLVTTFGD